MATIKRIVRGGCLLGLMALLAGCIIAPRDRGYHEGYYDAPHHRYWHNNGWHDCGDRDPHCR